ncbi:MAG: Crp/Fnr family transcriptional regulator [Chitinophagaceae bacterium]|jgi:CRP-like cAMP-binding protein|nr:Crp/Fnr family transcriptional regulator [Chitinophagaceae bacterium]
MLPGIEGLYHVERSKTALPEGVITPSAFLNAIHPISAKAARFVDSRAFFCTVPKGKHLLRQGVVCPYMFLLVKGVMRSYIMEGKNEITTWITSENELISSISSVFDQRPSQENIQALEDCAMIGLPYDDLETAYQKFIEVNIPARKILQILYRQAEERAYITRLTKASSRYAYYAERNPEILSRVPLKHIASFLGMKMETLSRLRGAISKHPREAETKTI